MGKRASTRRTQDEPPNQLGDDTGGRIPAGDRTIFGVILPHVVLVAGWYVILRFVAGDSAGAGACLLPFPLVLSAAITAFALPPNCRSRTFAFLVGSIIPFWLLLVLFLLVMS